MIATPKGGTHVSGFESAITSTFNDVMRSAKVLKVNDDNVIKDDVLEGMTGVVTVRLAEPQFEGQTKEILGTPAARNVVRKVVAGELKNFLTSTKRAEKAQAKLVMEKVVGASKTRIAAKQHKENQRRKNALESSALPAKLADCRSADNERTELFIVEGDSAMGTAKFARDSEYQALLPIRGKILNVQKASVGDMLKNTECASIIQVVGAGSGRTFELEAARYGRIIFMADADSDGSHIRCLLATLFFKYMPELVRDGRRLHRRTAAAPDRADQPQEGDGEVRLHLLRRRAAPSAGRAARRRTCAGRSPGSATRGSVRWTPTSWRRPRWTRATARCAGSPSTTSTRRSRVFELLMGSDVAPRKEFIVQGAYEVDVESLDA